MVVGTKLGSLDKRPQPTKCQLFSFFWLWEKLNGAQKKFRSDRFDKEGKSITLTNVEQNLSRPLTIWCYILPPDVAFTKTTHVRSQIKTHPNRSRLPWVCCRSAVWLEGTKVVKMLTPRFSLDQCEDHLTVKIYAPFTNVADTEVFFDEQDFRFYSRPYFLRLHLPAQVQVCSHPLYLNCDQNV